MVSKDYEGECNLFRSEKVDQYCSCPQTPYSFVTPKVRISLDVIKSAQAYHPASSNGTGIVECSIAHAYKMLSKRNEECDFNVNWRRGVQKYLNQSSGR